MLCQVHGRGLGRCSRVIDDEFVAIRKRISNACLEGARVSLFPVGARVLESDAGPLDIPKLFGLPDPFVETSFASVKVIRSIVRGQHVGLTIQGKPAFRNPVGEAANDGAHVWRVILDVTFRSVVTENDVIKIAGPVRHADGRNDSTVGYSMHFYALRVF